jgi:hypothetical protein
LPLAYAYCARKPSVVKSRIVGQILLCECGKEKRYDSLKCLDCYNNRRTTKIVWPPDDELVKMVNSSNLYAVGKQLNVSDNGVRRRLKKRNLFHLIIKK